MTFPVSSRWNGSRSPEAGGLLNKRRDETPGLLAAYAFGGRVDGTAPAPADSRNDERGG